jgi:hypothetical protein
VRETYRSSPIRTVTEELRSAAHAYALLGWPVFPLTPRQKVPLYRNPHTPDSPERRSCRGMLDCGTHGHGVLDATLDPDVIDGWWLMHPTAGIGMACGRTIDADGAVREAPDVVDIDVKKGAPGAFSRERLRRTGLLAGCFAQVRTPTGGEHLYFEPTTQGNGAIPKSGVDFRSAGGYVVMPPTQVWVEPGAVPDDDGQPREGHMAGYRWLVPPRLDGGGTADWAEIKRLLKPPHLWPPRELGTGRDAEGVDALVAWLGRQGEGNRNAALHWACCKALESDASADLEPLAAAGRGLKLDAAEVRKTVESARRKILVAVAPRGGGR